MTYAGGKNGAGVYQQIINQIPPHQRYIEAFAGGAAIARLKRPASSTLLIEKNPDQAEQLRTVGHIVICGDALEELERLRPTLTPDTFIYLDPPYLFSSRSGGTKRLYAHEFGTEQEHRDLLSLILTLGAPIAISGYSTRLYADMLHGWRSITFTTIKRSGERATEWLWMNYPEPTALHDYRYLGNNFRERERIKRKKQRWAERLRRLPALERYALLSALDEFSTTAGATPEPTMAAGTQNQI